MKGFWISLLLSLALPFTAISADTYFGASINIFKPDTFSVLTPINLPIFQSSALGQSFLFTAEDEESPLIQFNGFSDEALHATLEQGQYLLGEEGVELAVYPYSAKANEEAALQLDGPQASAAYSAKAKIPANAKPGLYEANVTFRVTYL